MIAPLVVLEVASNELGAIFLIHHQTNQLQPGNRMTQGSFDI